jgi:class 3 adenylate cyclase
MLLVVVEYGVDLPSLPVEAGALLAFLPCWIWLTARLRLRDSPSLALGLHLVDITVVLVLLPGIPDRAVLPLLVMLLAGPLALGGATFFVPCLAVLAGAIAAGRVPLPPPPEALTLMLTGGFTLSVAWVSFRQAQRLHAAHILALDRSRALDTVNARLARYLPDPVRDLARSDPAGQRPDYCWVTVAFVDLVGFAAFVRNRPAAEIVEVVNSYQCALDALARRHGGVLGKFLGDGVLVYYQEASDRRGDAARCLALVRALPGLLGELNGRWRQQGQLLNLAVRVGVASGYCAVGDWGGERRLDHTVIGDAVNRAARLQQAARPGGALLDESTAALLDGADGPRERGAEPTVLDLKGIGETRAYALVDGAWGRL